MQKPDGLTVITKEDIRARIWPLPVRKLWGVGPKTESHLKGMGIQTIGDLASWKRDRLIGHFGTSHGEYLYESSRGIDESPMVTHWEPKSLSRETTFQRDTGDWEEISQTLAELTEEVVNDIMERRYRGKTVTIKIRFSDFKTYTRGKTLPEFTDSEEEIRRTAFECLRRIELKKKVRLLGVRISHFEKISEGISEETPPATRRQGDVSLASST